MPLLAGSATKVLIAYMEKKELTPIVSSIARATKQTQAQVLSQIAAVREKGFAVSHGERLLGVSAISAPIKDAEDQVHYCLSIGGPSVRIQLREKELVKLAVNAAAEISLQFGAQLP